MKFSSALGILLVMVAGCGGTDHAEVTANVHATQRDPQAAEVARGVCEIATELMERRARTLRDRAHVFVGIMSERDLHGPLERIMRGANPEPGSPKAQMYDAMVQRFAELGVPFSCAPLQRMFTMLDTREDDFDASRTAALRDDWRAMCRAAKEVADIPGADLPKLHSGETQPRAMVLSRRLDNRLTNVELLGWLSSLAAIAIEEREAEAERFSAEHDVMMCVELEPFWL